MDRLRNDLKGFKNQFKIRCLSSVISSCDFPVKSASPNGTFSYRCSIIRLSLERKMRANANKATEVENLLSLEERLLSKNTRGS